MSWLVMVACNSNDSWRVVFLDIAGLFVQLFESNGVPAHNLPGEYHFETGQYTQERNVCMQASGLICLPAALDDNQYAPQECSAHVHPETVMASRLSSDE